MTEFLFLIIYWISTFN